MTNIKVLFIFHKRCFKPPKVTFHRDLHPGANPPWTLSKVHGLASSAPTVGIQESLLREWAESSVGWRREEGTRRNATPPTTAETSGPGGWDPGRATTSQAPPQTGAVPAGQRSTLPHLGRPTRLGTQGPTGPARAHLTLPQLGALRPAPARRHRQDARSADSRGRGLQAGAEPQGAGWGGGPTEWVELSRNWRRRPARIKIAWDASATAGKILSLGGTIRPRAHFSSNRRLGEET